MAPVSLGVRYSGKQIGGVISLHQLGPGSGGAVVADVLHLGTHGSDGDSRGHSCGCS